jgi:hypothetical protein
VSTTGGAARMNGAQLAPGMRIRPHQRAHIQTSLSSGRMSTPGPLRYITQALVGATCAYGHNTHRDLCDL